MNILANPTFSTQRANRLLVTILWFPCRLVLHALLIIAAVEASEQPIQVQATIAQPSLTFVSGWNLVGNGFDTPIDVTAVFSDQTRFKTVWKWNASANSWAFYAPSLAAQAGTALADYRALKGYLPLNTISGGEGFWVDAVQATSVTPPPGNPLDANATSAGLVPGWNLAAIGTTSTAKQYTASQSTNNGKLVTSVWAWDSVLSTWFFYAPYLDASGALASHITSNGYKDFTVSNKTLGPGVGFWVNVAPVDPFAVSSGSIQGHLYSAVDGTVSTGNASGNGAMALVGASVSLVPARAYSGTIRTGTDLTDILCRVTPTLSISSTTNSDGYFMLSNVPLGMATVQVSRPDGYCQRFPVTVFAQRTVNLDTPQVSRARALSLVQANLVSPAPALRVIMAPPTPLPTGSEIAPALGGPGLTYVPSLGVVTTAPKWLFYIDDHPNLGFQRNAATSPIYFLVDTVTGDVESHVVTSWLSINGRNYYANLDENSVSQDLVLAPALTSLPHAVPPLPTSPIHSAGITARALRAGNALPLATASHPPQTIALLIAGSDEQAPRADVQHMVDAIRNSQIPGLPPLYSIYVYQAHDSATPKRDIAALFTALSAAAQPGDTFILYFSGHGAAGELVLDSNVDITTKLSLWQNAQRAILGDPKFLEQYLGVEDFKFGALSACHVYVIVEACFSGTITIDGTVVRYEGITGSEHAGRDYAVLTSTAKDELSAGYNTGQVILGLGAIVGGSDFTEEGGAFTSHLLHALTHYGGNTTYQALNGAFEDAKAAMNTQVYIASRPQKISGVNPGICPCLTRLAPASNTIQVGGRVTLTGLDPYDRTIPTSNLTWTASNSSATVVSGVVTGVSPGTVTVTATQTNTSPPITATALITVQAAPALPLEVTSFSPYQGSLPGSQLTINGTSLGGAAATVLFTDASGQNTLAGVVAPDSADSQLRVTVPSAARTGYFQVSNAGASSYSRNFGLPAPLIVGGPVSIAFGVVSNAGDTAVVVGPNANCFDVTSGASLDIEPTVPIVTSTIPGFSIRFITNFGSVALAGTYNPTDGSYTASTAGSVGSRYTVTGRINSDGSGSGTLSESKTYSIWTCTGTTTFTTSSRP